MNKKLILWIIVMSLSLLVSPAIYGLGYDYKTMSTSQSGCEIYVGYSLSSLIDGNLDFGTDGGVYSQSPSQNCYWSVDFDDNYTVDYILMWQFGDGGDPDGYGFNISVCQSGVGCQMVNKGTDDLTGLRNLNLTSDNFTAVEGDSVRLIAYDFVGGSIALTEFISNETTAAAPSEGFTITVLDYDNSSSASNFTATISNETDTYINISLTGDINFENISTGLYNIIISSDVDGGYHDYTTLNYDVSVDLEVNLIKFYQVLNITYSNFTEFNQTNFTRALVYDIAYRCPSFSNTTLGTYTNESIAKQLNLTCTNETRMFNASISNSYEGNFSIWHLLNTTYLPNINNELFGNTSFISDLINPDVLLNFTIPEGFAMPKTNTSLICSDNIFIGNLTYNATFNGVTLTFANFSNATTLTNETVLIDGYNLLIASCSDPFGKTTVELNKTVYNAEIILIDEMDNVIFDLDNVTRVRAYFDNNQSFYDFTSTGYNSTEFSASMENRLRIELIYSTGIVVTRYIDLAILGDEVRICANKEGVTHYQQLIVSARERDTILRNVFANCIVAADSTRFAFQDSFVLQAFTISSLYSLVTVREGREIILASLDGSLETFINLDSLELAETPFNLNIQPESISFEKTGTSIMKIRYLNLKRDNIGLTIDITNMDTDSSVYSSSSFADLNDVTIFFDFSTLSNVSNTTLFVIQADSTQTLTTNSFKRYFNTNASSGIVRSEVAFVISLLLVIFGLTFTATRLTLSWFGIFMLIFAISTLSMAVLTTPIIFLMAVETILLVFIFVVLSINTHSTLT